MTTALETESAQDTDRIGRILSASRSRGADQPPSPYLARLAEAHDRYADLPWRLRQARARADALADMPVYLFPDERLVGMVYHCGPIPEVENPTDYARFGAERVREALPENEELIAFGICRDGAMPGHITWHWDWILEKGVLGLLDEYREAVGTARDDVARAFYEGVILSLEALLRWNDRHVEALREELGVAQDEETVRLRSLIELCERVPAHRARTFHEAVQSFYFQHLAVMRESPYGGNGPGRLDTLLWPYLEQDIDSGAITMEDARELIDELFIRIEERVQDRDGWVEAVVVGGSHSDGSSSVNPLSYMMVESIIDLDQTHPTIYMRMPEDSPPEWVELAGRYLLEGKNRAQILNDPAITEGLRGYGLTAEDASMYTCGGCMEVTPQGMNSDLLFSGWHNVAKTVELALTGGVCLKTRERWDAAGLAPLAAHDSFETLYEAFEGELRRELKILFSRYDFYSEAMAEHRPLYLMSSMTADCLERGRELHDGGARYHHYGSSPLGIPNAADALYAAKHAVFDEGICTAEELLEALRSDFEGQEALRLRLRALPKYGQQHAEADAMMARVLSSVCEIYSSHRNRLSGRVKPVVLTFVWAPMAGAALGATADGQHAGTPVAHGLTPQKAGLSEGITSAIGSCTGLPLSKVSGGASTMWDLDHQWIRPVVAEHLLTTFLELGGHIFQGNTTDVEELVRAREDPRSHPNLLVRVGGYSARFVSLAPELQEEIITRHRHST